MSNNDQQNPVGALQARIAELEGLVASNANQRRQVTRKPKKPRPYNGDGAPQGFLIQARVYLRQLDLGDEADKVLEIITCLEGKALEWFEPSVKDYLENPAEDDQETATQELFADYSNFEQRLKQNFDNPDKERQAAQQLMNVKQKGPASKYAVEFRNLMLKAGQVDGNDDDIIIDMFYRGLKDDVKDEAIRIKRPISLADYITEVVTIDNRQFERRLEKKGQYTPKAPQKSNQGKRRYNNNNPSTSYGTAPGPMELGATRQGNNFKCYNCGKTGHLARNCRSPRQDNGSRWTPVPEGRQRNQDYGQKKVSFGAIRIRPSVQHGMDMARQLAQAAAREVFRKNQQERRANGELYVWLMDHAEWNDTLFGETDEQVQKRLQRQRRALGRRQRKTRQLARQVWLLAHYHWDEDLAPGSMEHTHHAVHPVNCHRRNCYWHQTKKDMICSRIDYMARYGFNFRTKKGPNAADNHWYNELRQHTETYHGSRTPSLCAMDRGWPTGQDCPQGYKCNYDECDHQTDEELLQRTVEKAIQRNITDLGFQRAFERNPEERQRLKEQIDELQQPWNPKGRSHL